MGTKATIWAWSKVNAITSPTVTLVFLGIADIANDRTGKLWASHKYIAEKVNLSPRSVRSGVQILTAMGLIRTEEKHGCADVIWLAVSPTTIFAEGPEADEEVSARTPLRGRKVRQEVPAAAASGARTSAPPADKPREEPNKGTEANASDARGARLPDHWEPDVVAATMIGLTHEEATAQGERFRDYWLGVPGLKGRKVDWAATWRNWCRRVAEEKPHGGSPALSAGADRAANQHSSRLQAMESGAREALDRWGRRTVGNPSDRDQ